MALGAADLSGGVAGDEEFIAVIGVADEAGGVFGRGLGSREGGGTFTFGGLIQEQGRIGIDNQRGKAVGLISGAAAAEERDNG